MNRQKVTKKEDQEKISDKLITFFYEWGKWAIVRLILIWVPIYFIFTHFFMFAYIPSESMEPTLKKGDIVLIQKTKDVKHNDIILFDMEVKPYPMETYCKRVIALSGETIEMKNNEVYLNGSMLKEDFIKEKIEYEHEDVVSENGVFVLGDNRNDSIDSVGFGSVPKDQIYGVVKLIIKSPF